MNILIINAFGSSPKSKYRFESFCNLVQNLFKKVSKGSGIDNFNFICRSPNHITEFIYKLDLISGDIAQNKKNKKNFDKLDIVIIDGYEKYVPWSNKSFILCEFIKLCKITNKILYAGGVALEILIYYLATGSLNEYNFVNSKGQIKALEEMSTLPKKYVKEIKANDNFLDFVTGDILEYKSNKTWVPIKNIGLHRQITAEKYMNRGQFVLPYKFKGKDSIKNEKAYVTVCNEIKVTITRQYLYHFLVDNLPLEFIAMTSLTWFPHFFNVNSEILQFTVICESEKGPVVIEHQNSTGVLFHISEKYPETVIFMENFIRNKFNEVQNKVFKFKKNLLTNDSLKTDKTEMPSIFKTYNSYEDIKKSKIKTEIVNLNNRKTIIDKVNNSRPFNRIKKIKSEASHVGFGINNRDMIFVENNYINQNPLFSMDKNNKNIEMNFLYGNDNKLIEWKKDKLLPKKLRKNSKTYEFKNISKYENQKNNNNFTKFKNLHIIIDSDSKEKKLKKRNIFFSYSNKKNINNINKDVLNFHNILYFHSRNKNSNNKKKIRMKSANFFNKTENNYNKKIKTIQNLEYNSIYPILNDISKNKKHDYFNNNEIESDEYDEMCIPKYPRPANIENENETKTLNINLELLKLINKNNENANYENNNYTINDNKINNINIKMKKSSKKKDIFLGNKNFINFGGINDNKNH